MPEEPTPHHPPRPVVPIPEQGPTDEIIDAQIVEQRLPAPLAPVPVQSINLPDETIDQPIPVANVYAPPQAAAPPSMTMTPPGPPPYYPPSYPHWGPPMDYRTAPIGAQYGRPGTVTSLAISSIVIASLSFFACFYSGCISIGVLANARATGGTATLTAPTATFQPASAQYPFAMAQPDRQAVYTAVQNATGRPLTPPRERQFEALLARYGRQIIDDPRGDPLTTQRVAQHIANVGQEFAGPGKTGPDFVLLKSSGKLTVTAGRIVVKDDAAVFYPTEGEPLRVMLKPEESIEPQAAPPVTPSTANAVIAPGLDASQARAVVSRVTALSNNNLNPQQSAALSTILQSGASANFVAPSSTIPGLTAQVKSAVVNNDSSITINFTQGSLTIDPNGQVAGSAGNLTLTPATMPVAANPFAFSLSANSSSCKLAITEAAISLLLAGLLLTAGILALRQNRLTRRLYLAWGVAKLAMAALAIVAYSWMISSLSAGNDTMGIGAMMLGQFQGMAGVAMWLAILGALFPIVVLSMLLFSRSMKDYFKSAA